MVISQTIQKQSENLFHTEVYGFAESFWKVELKTSEFCFCRNIGDNLAESAGTVGNHIRPKLSTVSEESSNKNIKVLEP